LAVSVTGHAGVSLGVVVEFVVAALDAVLFGAEDKRSGTLVADSSARALFTVAGALIALLGNFIVEHLNGAALDAFEFRELERSLAFSAGSEVGVALVAVSVEAVLAFTFDIRGAVSASFNAVGILFDPSGGALEAGVGVRALVAVVLASLADLAEFEESSGAGSNAFVVMEGEVGLANEALGEVGGIALIAVLIGALLALVVDNSEAFTAVIDALLLLVEGEGSFALVAGDGVTAVGAGSVADLADIEGVSEGANRAVLDAGLAVQSEAFLAKFTVLVVTGLALGALGVVAGLALVVLVLVESGGASADTTVVVDNEALLASVTVVLVRVALDALGVNTGDAGGSGEESLEVSGTAVFNAGGFVGETEGGSAVEALGGVGAGAGLAVGVDALDAGLAEESPALSAFLDALVVLEDEAVLADLAGGAVGALGAVVRAVEAGFHFLDLLNVGSDGAGIDAGFAVKLGGEVASVAHAEVDVVAGKTVLVGTSEALAVSFDEELVAGKLAFVVLVDEALLAN
jgi:hypothetical protein